VVGDNESELSEAREFALGVCKSASIQSEGGLPRSEVFPQPLASLVIKRRVEWAGLLGQFRD